jgi:uncharacterized protein (TIGR02246 family)
MRNGRRFGLVAALAAGLVVSAGTMPAPAEDSKPKGKRVEEFIQAFNKGNARALAAFWTPDGEYVDQSGHQVKGRAAIEKAFEKVLAGRKGVKLAITVTSAQEVTPDVVLEDGFSAVTPADGGPPSVSRFSVVLVKKDGVWSFASLRESPAQTPSNADHFADLAWLIGDWKGEADKGESARASYAWAENQNFIVSAYAITENGIPVAAGHRWIGWDAIGKQVRSWSFYSGGGFGESVWTHDGNKWLIKTTAQTADGKKVSVTNVVTRIDNDHMTWERTRVTVDGKAMPDHAPLKLTRVKAERP